MKSSPSISDNEYVKLISEAKTNDDRVKTNKNNNTSFVIIEFILMKLSPFD